MRENTDQKNSEYGYYSRSISVVEKSSGTKPASVLGQENTNLSKTIDIVVEKYSSHLSVTKIKKIFKNLSSNKVYKLSKNINANRVTGCDLIPLKFVRIAADQLAEPFICIVNSLYYSKYL